MKPNRVELLWCCEEVALLGIMMYPRWSNSVKPMCNFKDRPITAITVPPDQIWMGFGGVQSPPGLRGCFT